MSSTSELVTLVVRDHIAEITIRRAAALNALSSGVLQELANTLKGVVEIISRPGGYEDCRLVTITGEGDKAFVAGADIREMASYSRADIHKFIILGQGVMRAIENLPVPVLSIVNGFAIGGGLELALASDLIVAIDSAKLGLAEVGLGLIPGFGGTQRLAERIGMGRAKRLIFTGEPVSAQEALTLGIVDWVVPKADLSTRVREIANSITSRGPLAVAAAKRAVAYKFDHEKVAGLSLEVEEFLTVFSSEDAKEGMKAFAEKRKPIFHGR